MFNKKRSFVNIKALRFLPTLRLTFIMTSFMFVYEVKICAE